MKEDQDVVTGLESSATTTGKELEVVLIGYDLRALATD